MSKSFSKQIEAIQKSLDSLKLKINKSCKKSPKKIGECTKKDQLNKFTIKELIEWLKKNKISIKKVSKKIKKKFVNIVWEHLIDDDSDSDSDSDSESECDSESESDSDSDSDSD